MTETIRPEDVRLWKKAIRTASAKHYAMAAHLFEKAIEDQPKQSHLWGSLGLCLFHLSRFDDSVRAFKKCLELGEQNMASLTLQSIACVLKKMGKPDRSQRYYRLAIKADPECSLGYAGLADLWSSMDCHRDAEEQYQKALSLSGSASPSVWYGLGVSLRAQEKYEEAQVAFTEAAKVDPRYKNDPCHHDARVALADVQVLLAS